MPSPFIVVPTYHELANLPLFTERLWHAVPDARLLLVDDASGDGTPAWVQAHPRLQLARSSCSSARASSGLGSAYVAGFRWVVERQARALLRRRADGCRPLPRSRRRSPDFLRALDDGADLVLATRYRDGVRVTNWPLHRLMLSLGAGKYVQIITGMPFTDPTGGFKAFRPDKLAELDLSPASVPTATPSRSR